MDRKAQILESAQILFAQFGLKKVSTDDIAREAGISKATLYKYFRNKTEVFNEIIDKEAGQLLQAIEEAVSTQSDSVEQLRAHLLTRLTRVDDFVNFYRVTQDSWGNYWPHIVRVRQRFLKCEQTVVENILRRGVTSGEFEIEDTARAALVLVLALASVEYQWPADEHGLRLPQLVDLMLGMMVNGIRRR